MQLRCTGNWPLVGGQPPFLLPLNGEVSRRLLMISDRDDRPDVFMHVAPRDQLREEYPTLFYHQVPPSSIATRHMERLRLAYLALAEDILGLCPPNRSRSLALTELEYSLMRAIQSLALTGELVDPREAQQQEEGRR